MTEEQINKLLEKIPTDKVYKALFHPGLKTAGLLLKDVLEIGNLVLLPFKIANIKCRNYLRRNMELYDEKVQEIDPEKRCLVDPQVGLQIVDKMTLINQEELRQMFVNLLTKASCIDTQDLVHPSFLNILNNLSKDEAIILFAYRDKPELPFIDIMVHKTIFPSDKADYFHKNRKLTKEEFIQKSEYESKIRKVQIRSSYNLTGIEKKIKLYFPQKIDLYLENLTQFGIIEFIRDKYLPRFNDQYAEMVNSLYTNAIDLAKERCREGEDDTVSMEHHVHKGFIQFTEFGRAFVDSVVTEIEELERTET